MKISYEQNAYDFLVNDSWAIDPDFKLELLNADKIDAFNLFVEELYPEGVDRTKLNDFLRFDIDWIREQLGLVEESEDEDE